MICRMCEKMKTTWLGHWVKISKGDKIDKLDPRGICPTCYKKMIEDRRIKK